MKKYLLLLITIFVSYTLSAQCLGNDCSIKGRNKAAKKKEQKMTGHRSGSGALSSVAIYKRKRKKVAGGFDPFAVGRAKGKGSSQGFDPFAAGDAKNKKRKNKGGSGFDPYASAGGKKGGSSSSGGFDPFANEGKSKHNKSSGGGTWANSDGKRKLKVSSAGYADWDGSKNRGSRHSRGSANDSWANEGGGRKLKTIKGGTWAEGTNTKTRSAGGSANDSWAQEGNKSPKSGGGIWAQGGSTGSSNHSNRHQSGNNNWDATKQSDPNATVAPPTYQQVDNTPKSYSDYENAGLSSDLVYDDPHQYKYSLIAGQIYKHTNKITSYLNGASVRPILGAEFAIEWPTVGSKNWHHYYNIPTTGLGFTYLNLGNDKLLGSAFAIYPYVDIPLIRTQPIDFNLTAGFGASCVTKWDKTSPSNPSTSSPDYMPMFGSPINVFLKGGFNLAFRPITNIGNQSQDAWSHFTFVLGASMMHMSNGSFAQPNTGLNMFAATIGMKYCPTVLTPVIKQSGEPLPHFLTLDFMGSGGVREMYRLDTKKYPVGNFNMTLYYQLANIYRIGLGADAFYDGAFGDTHNSSFTTYDGLYDPTKFADRLRAGGCLSNEFVLGRVTAALDGGYYFYDPIKAPGESVYFRFAMKYRFTSRFFGAVALKTHKLDAEFVTLGLGYSLPL